MINFYVFRQIEIEFENKFQWNRHEYSSVRALMAASFQHFSSLFYWFEKQLQFVMTFVNRNEMVSSESGTQVKSIRSFL